MTCRTTLLNNVDNDLILRKFILELIRPGKDVCKGCDKPIVPKNEELIIDFDRFVIQVRMNIGLKTQDISKSK